jgi:hypothetical protein
MALGHQSKAARYFTEFQRLVAKRPDVKRMMKLWFPWRNETLYLADTDENSVFAAAK